MAAGRCLRGCRGPDVDGADSKLVRPLREVVGVAITVPLVVIIAIPVRLTLAPVKWLQTRWLRSCWERTGRGRARGCCSYILGVRTGGRTSRPPGWPAGGGDQLAGSRDVARPDGRDPGLSARLG